MPFSLRRTASLLATSFPNRRSRLSAWLCLSLGLSSGCYPVTSFQTPTTLAPGTSQVSVGLGGATRGRSEDGSDVPMDLGVRVGLAKNLDAGARVRFGGLELDGKYQLVRSDLEVSTSLGALWAVDKDDIIDEWVTPDDNAEIRGARAAVYFGSSSTETASVWCAPKVDVGQRLIDLGDGYSQADDLFVALGLSVGTVVSVSPSNRLGFEVAVLEPVVGTNKLNDDAYGDSTYDSHLGPGDTRLELSFSYTAVFSPD